MWGRPISCYSRATALTSSIWFFFFNQTATTEIYTLSLHDALPILEMKERQEIIATGTLYANVIIKFGKYKQKIEKVHHEVSVVLKQREIVVQPIENLHNGADQIELEIG